MAMNIKTLNTIGMHLERLISPHEIRYCILWQDYTGIQGTCYATISGSTKPFGSFSSVTEIVMVVNNGVMMPQSSSLSSDDSNLTVTYISSR